MTKDEALKHIHEHVGMQKMCEVPKDHVIIDREVYEALRKQTVPGRWHNTKTSTKAGRLKMLHFEMKTDCKDCRFQPRCAAVKMVRDLVQALNGADPYLDTTMIGTLTMDCDSFEEPSRTKRRVLEL